MTAPKLILLQRQQEPHSHVSKQYAYLVRIIPPAKKDTKTFEWHGVTEVFTSPSVLKQKLIDSFQNKIPGDSEALQVGYIAKRGNGKRWIEEQADLTSMYMQFEHSNTITLFCEGHSESIPKQDKATTSRKRKSNYEDHEEEVKKIAIELEEKHGDKYNERQLRLWARMIFNKQHEDLEEPPNIPIITGGVKRPAKKETLTDALSSVAIALTKAISPQSQASGISQPTTPKSHLKACPTGVSPASKASISAQYISQLKSIQDLRECGVLSEKEFEEQKMYALNNIRRLNSSMCDI